ncbi:MAG: squalene synthase HpnC [Rhodospirillaceae bacterium]|nr:squalene synthase HpnC [Rhodospirillaceae bacterium]
MTGQATGGINSSGGARRLIDENTENFPVGSFLIGQQFRPHVHAFYLFAREADDIADSPDIQAEEKIAQLEAVQRAITIDETALPDWSVPYHRSLLEQGLSSVNGCYLLSAFIQDATKQRYRDWDDLMDYCMRSAASVGRVMMDIHGETDADIEGSDALCCALQVLNHLQDCKKDYLALDRVYLPEPWLIEAGGGVEDLAHDRETPAVRRVIDRCLDETELLLHRAERMPRSVRRRGLRLESAFIVNLAWALSRQLRRQDPLANPVKVSKLGWLLCGLKGVVGAW